uniref:Uncharacterized protein n=1 Tax=Anopheles culicifacies TaxID=139723 RepID=A0A182LXV4_9DIPT
MFFEDNIDNAKYCGHLYGLGTPFVANGNNTTPGGGASGGGAGGGTGGSGATTGTGGQAGVASSGTGNTGSSNTTGGSSANNNSNTTMQCYRKPESIVGLLQRVADEVTLRPIKFNYDT